MLTWETLDPIAILRQGNAAEAPLGEFIEEHVNSRQLVLIATQRKTGYVQIDYGWLGNRLVHGFECRLIGSGTTMANLYYKDRLIIAYTSLNQSDQSWSGGAEITWRQDDQRHSHTVGGLTDKFKKSEDAEKFVVNLAKAWIDANG